MLGDQQELLLGIRVKVTAAPGWESNFLSIIFSASKDIQVASLLSVFTSGRDDLQRERVEGGKSEIRLCKDELSNNHT